MRFKHGANKNIKKTIIDIDIKIIDSFLYFTVTNPMPAKTIYTKNSKSGGIGLKNVKKRLSLRYKKEEYKLKIFEKNKRFNVQLKIKMV